jgi:hypothetical protein
MSGGGEAMVVPLIAGGSRGDASRNGKWGSRRCRWVDPTRQSAGGRRGARGWWAYRRYVRAGSRGVGEKNITFFCRNAYFIVLLPYPLQKHMTGGSDMRGKVGPIWVRKVFNCLRSL